MEKEERTEERVEQVNNDLMDFTFDTGSQLEVENMDDDYSFSLDDDGAEKKKKKEETEEPEEETKEEEEKKKKKKKEDVVENEDGSTEYNNIEVNPEEEEPSDPNYFNQVFDNFKEMGIIGNDVELEEGKKLTNDELVEILENEKFEGAKRIFEQEIVSKFKGDDDAMAFLQFKLKGGNTKDFFDTYRQSTEFGFDGDISDAKYQDKVLKYYFENYEDYDDEEIEEHIEMLTDNGKKEKYAKKYLEAMKKDSENQKKQLDVRMKQIEKEREEKMNNYISLMGSTIEKMEDIAGTRFDEKRKSRIFSMLTDNNIKLQDGRTVTGFNLKMSQIMSDPVKLVILADLIDNDLDFSKYEKKIETKVTKKIRQNLITNKPNHTRSKGNDWF